MKIIDLIESNNIHDAFADALKQPFFQYNEINKNNLLVHYTEDVPMKGFEKRTLRTRSKPRDSSPLVHEYLAHLSKQKFGFVVRAETLFTYASSHSNDELVSGAEYGDATVIVPIGEYKLYHSPGVVDFTNNYKTAFYGDKLSFLMSKIRTSPELNMNTLTEIEHLVRPEIEAQKNGDDVDLDRNIKFYIMDMTTTISVDFSSVFKSEKLSTLEEEIPDIAKFIVDRTTSNHGYTLSNDTFNQVVKVIERIINASVKKQLSEYQDYINRMTVTLKVTSFNNDEYMLRCKEFYMFDYTEFMTYLDKMVAGEAKNH